MKLDVIFNRTAIKESKSNSDHFVIGAYTFAVKTRVLSTKSVERRLSPKEGALFNLLCEHMNDVLPREKALIEIWGEDNYFTTRSMDVYITKLRKYLKEDSRIQIDNVHSSGYRMLVD